ncbi:MAG: SMC family ATPase, partial [Longispora sp.]|nr:SMC family ATPase [Longispora sp. (in: high G+C Gram-positive bacteria)]
VTTAGAKLAETRERLVRAEAWFVDKLDRQSAAAAFAEAQEIVKRVEAAGVELRKLRTTRQSAQSALDATRATLQQAWGAYDRARDAVAGYRPPTADRADLAGSWEALSGWAVEQRAALKATHLAMSTAADSSNQTVVRSRAAMVALFEAAELTCGGGQYVRDAAVAVERAYAVHRSLTQARERAERLASERDTHATAARTARALAQHLNANNFKRWLLAEALDQLVDGASALLLELSGGQYELGHDKGEFYVIDHYDAEQRRAVRTLSGGETFQASLALALALSDRLAGMSSNSATLGSILLDEGFGTLDSATLDTVTATLENLAARGDRIVGVVTHVPALAERIPMRFEVRKDARSAYVERVL